VRVTGAHERIQELREFVSAENPLKRVSWYDMSAFEKEFEYQNNYLDFVEARHKAQPLALSLNSIVPQPDNIFRGNLGTEEREMCEREGRPNWYDWNIANWGTKWDVRAELTEISDNEIEYSFDSAWAPPVAVIAKLAEHFPDLEITHTYAELGCEFAGMCVYINGELEHERRDNISFTDDEDDPELIGPDYVVGEFGYYA
jgi:hypothetical protein